jgi:hypothetical protein
MVANARARAIETVPGVLKTERLALYRSIVKFGWLVSRVSINFSPIR